MRKTKTTPTIYQFSVYVSVSAKTKKAEKIALECLKEDLKVSGSSGAAGFDYEWTGIEEVRHVKRKN